MWWLQHFLELMSLASVLPLSLSWAAPWCANVIWTLVLSALPLRTLYWGRSLKENQNMLSITCSCWQKRWESYCNFLVHIFLWMFFVFDNNVEFYSDIALLIWTSFGQVREHMASMGVRKFQELVGRTDLLRKRDSCSDKAKLLDFSHVLKNALHMRPGVNIVGGSIGQVRPRKCCC